MKRVLVKLRDQAWKTTSELGKLTPMRISRGVERDSDGYSYRMDHRDRQAKARRESPKRRTLRVPFPYNAKGGSLPTDCRSTGGCVVYAVQTLLHSVRASESRSRFSPFRGCLPCSQLKSRNASRVFEIHRVWIEPEARVGMCRSRSLHLPESPSGTDKGLGFARPQASRRKIYTTSTGFSVSMIGREIGLRCIPILSLSSASRSGATFSLGNAKTEHPSTWGEDTR